MAGSKFICTHGVDTHVQYPDRTEEVQHRGSGTRVRQRARPSPGNENWFHLALPTATYFDAEEVRFDRPYAIDWVKVNATLNENAIITTVDIWEGGRRLERFPGGDDEFGLDLRGPEVSEAFDMTNQRLSDHQTDDPRRSGLSVSVRVLFRDGDPVGEVFFRGAGAWLSKRD